MPRLSASIQIKANRNTVFQILRDIENYPRYFRYVRRTDIVSREKDVVVAEIGEEIYGMTQHMRTRFRFLPPARVEAEQLKGPFQSAFGLFLLEEIEEGTQLNHVAEFELGKGILGRLIQRFIADSYAQDRMAEELVAIKHAAEERHRQVQA